MHQLIRCLHSVIANTLNVAKMKNFLLVSLLRFKILDSVLFLRHYLLEFTLQVLVSCNEMTKFKEIQVESEMERSENGGM